MVAEVQMEPQSRVRVAVNFFDRASTTLHYHDECHKWILMTSRGPKLTIRIGCESNGFETSTT